MSSSTQNTGPSKGKLRTPVPPALISVDGALHHGLPPVNPLSGFTSPPALELPRPQEISTTGPSTAPTTARLDAESAVFAADPVNLADGTQNTSNTISASGGSTSNRTVPVANSALRGDRIMLQNSLLTCSDESATNRQGTPWPVPGANMEAKELSAVKPAYADPNRPQNSSGSFNPLFPYEPSDTADRCENGHSAARSSRGAPAVFSSQEGVAPLSESVRKLRRYNIWLSLLLVGIAVVLAVIGGVCIGVVSNHYTKVTSVKFLNIKNRIVLNSSLSSLTDSSAALVDQARQLDRFVQARADDYSTPAEIRDDLRNDFISSWALWLHGRNSAVSMYSIKVPFCNGTSVMSRCGCGMVLIIQCDPTTEPAAPHCYLSENSDNGTWVNIYELSRTSTGLYDVGDLMGTSSYSDVYGNIRVNTSDGLFLEPSYVTGPDDSVYFFLKFAEQNRLAGGHTVFTETGSFLNSWFTEFQNRMQSADDSISVLFTNRGDVLEYTYGVDVPNPTEPCSFSLSNETVNTTRSQCGRGAGALVDDFVSTFVDQLPASVLEEDVINSAEYASLLNVDHYTVAYQDFLRFRTPLDEPNIIFFAAYATPIITGLTSEGVIQIVICVVIIVVCLLILGCITLFAVMSFQRVVEMVSVVANYAATYDTDAMLRVLNKPTVRFLPNTQASKTVRHEFFRILENLMAYRPFLPPALLTAEGLANLSETNTDSQAPPDVQPLSSSVPYDHPLSPPTPVPQVDSDYPRSLASPQSTQVPRPESPTTEHSTSASVAIHSLRSDNDLAANNDSLVVKPATNSRLAVSGLRIVKGTVLVAYLCNIDNNVENTARLINSFVRVVLEAAAMYNGVVDVLDATRIVVTFNCHYTTPRHSDKACKCALRIKHDLRHTDCVVAMGISSGTNYLGTIGTDRQKARVVTGEAVNVAHSLVLLRYYLGTTILATESTVHVSTCVSVPVDVVASFSEGTRTWRQYVVWEVLDGTALEQNPQAALAKKLFRMIRSRQGTAALAVVEAYINDAEHTDVNVSWRLLRLLALLKRQQPLIARGYVRCQTHWQNLEFTDTVPQTESELEVGFLAALGDGKDDDLVARRPSDVAARHNEMTNNPDEEASRVREMLGVESSRISATKRRMVALHQQKDPEDSEGALFDVYVPEQEEFLESAPPSTSQRTTAAEPLPQNSSAHNHSSFNAPARTGGSGEYSVTDDLRESPIPSVLPVELVSGAGQQFYRTNEVLGRGTYGNVFLAISQRGLFVAVKVFPVEEFNTAQLMREVETLAQLRSDYIVAYDCCGAQNGYFFICTEYLAGGSLRGLLKNLPCLPPSVVRKYARDILLGLQYLHTRNWTHCDIKPENVLLSGDGVCKLADFGNAALARSWAEDTSSIRGTARYMAPEAVLSEWKPPADIFSLGITMAYMLTGRQPWHEYPERDHLFVARYAGEIRHAVERNEPCAMVPDLSMAEAELVDPELCQIVRLCCAFRAADRPTVDALLNYMT